MVLSTKEIAELLKGTVEGNETLTISKLAKIEEGEQESLTFLANPKYTPYIYTTKASAVVVNNDFQPEQSISATLIRVENAYSAFGKLLEVFSPDQQKKLKGVSRKAKIHRSASIGKNVYIGDFVVIKEDCKIGDNTVIHANTTIYHNVTIKNDCTIHSNVSILENSKIGNNCVLHSGVVIGAEGFGFAPVTDGDYQKIPQIGNVVLEDKVEIGANSTVDRATIGSTIIRKGTKIDNLCQIAHNCDIGSGTVIAAQTGISGSTKIGNNCMIGGQVGIAGHLQLGNNLKIAAQSGIMSNIPDNSVHMGSPSFEARDYKKSYIYFMNLDKLAKRITQLEHQLQEKK